MADLIVLSDHERDRFADYLAQEARTNNSMADQMEKVRSPAALIAKYRAVAMAARVMEVDLRSGESMTIGGQPG